jgi:hypothetical protein
VRDFIHTALRHSAVTDLVGEYVFDIATSGEEPPAEVGEALRVAIGEVLSAASREDWDQVGRQVLAQAIDTVSEHPQPPAAAQPEEAIRAAWWPVATRRRKAPVKIRQEAILEWLAEVRSATLREVAKHFGISTHTARMKSDGLVAQGKLHVRPGARAKGSRPVIERRYSIPGSVDPASDGLAGELAITDDEHPADRLALSGGSS